MNNEAEINVEIPEITAMFVGTKGKYGFAQVVDDFPNAKEVRILTYSRIGYGNNNLKLRELQTLSPETKLCIIVALPGLKNPKIDGQYEHNQFREDSIVMELGKIKQQFDISQYSSKDVEMYVCFKNHAKLIGTENVLYIGSANYSDNSVQNYEAGMIIRDKSVIKEIYEKYFDEIVAVRYYADEYDTIRLKILSIAEGLENLKMDIDIFIDYFEDRAENADNMKKTYMMLLNKMKEVIMQLESCDGKLMETVLSDICGVQNVMEDISRQIYDAFDSGYEKDIEFFADYYEEYHKERMGVNSCDSWIDEDTPYILLSEEVEQEYYVSEYWTDELKKKYEILAPVEVENTQVLYGSNLCLDTEEKLIDYLARLKSKRVDPISEKSQAFQEFTKLLYHAKQIIAGLYQHDEEEKGGDKVWTAERITPSDVEKVICSGIPINKMGNLKKMSASILAKHFSQKRFSRQRITNILSHKLPVERFDLITLEFFIVSQEMEDDDPFNRYKHFLDEIQDILLRCGMGEIYIVNPYECFLLMCLLTDCPLAVFSEIWEKSYEEGEAEEA